MKMVCLIQLIFILLIANNINNVNSIIILIFVSVFKENFIETKIEDKSLS